jgi:hypothetical protein
MRCVNGLSPGRIIGCFLPYGMLALLVRPPTRRKPSLSTRGDKLLILLDLGSGHLDCTDLISAWKAEVWTIFTQNFSAQFNSLAVRGGGIWVEGILGLWNDDLTRALEMKRSIQDVTRLSLVSDEKRSMIDVSVVTRFTATDWISDVSRGGEPGMGPKGSSGDLSHGEPSHHSSWFGSCDG